MQQIGSLVIGSLMTIVVAFGLACSDIQKAESNNSLESESPVIAQNGNPFRRRNQQRQRMERSPRNQPDAQNTNQKASTGIEVSPQLTDPSINNWADPHYVVFDPSAKSRNKLLVFFPGSFGKANRQQLITQTAAAQGYHAVNLNYPNSWTVGSLCRGNSDPDCYGKVRREIIEGQDYSPLVDVRPADSISNRLVKLVQYLNRQHPQQGWGQYLNGNTLRWDQVVVAGHSQGGGHAAMVGKQYQVARVVMLGSPADFDIRTRQPAAWLAVPGKTPASRYFGFVHEQDQGYEQVLQAWELLGMKNYGPVVKVDGKQPPYENSHRLTTGLAPARKGKYHGSVATDGTTPKQQNGAPAFEQVWRYLFN